MLATSRPSHAAPAAVRTRASSRLTRAVAVAAACTAVGVATVVIARDQPAPAPAERTTEPVTTRYFDTAANKGASMRALSRYVTEQQATRTAGYGDLEANKARSYRSR